MIILSNHHDNLSLEMREILQSFHSQVTSSPLTFSASGFFSLNYEFLASLATGILSYLIVIVQFNEPGQVSIEVLKFFVD
jgi:7tm Chemosensory receptor